MALGGCISLFQVVCDVHNESATSIHAYLSRNMSFSRETSAGYFTGEEGGQRSRHGPTASRATQLRVCPECGCYLEALSREIMDLKEDNRCLRCQLEKESVSGECKYVLTVYM